MLGKSEKISSNTKYVSVMQLYLVNDIIPEYLKFKTRINEEFLKDWNSMM